MWESRVLSEISKALWKPLCGVHRTSFPRSSFCMTERGRSFRGYCTLFGLPIVVLELPTRSFSSADLSDAQVLLRDLLGAQVGVDFGAPAPRSAFKYVRVMEQAVEERRDGGGVPEQLAPIVHRSV